MAEDAERPQGPAQQAPAPANRPPAERPAGSTQPRPTYGGQDRPGGGSRPPPRGGSGGRERRGRPRYYPRRKVCAFCVDHVTAIDYKSVDVLKRYLSDRARIDPRRKTGTCARHQRMLAHAMKRARHLALLPFSMDHILQSGIDVGGRRNF
ncbi:MAG: 30S ribosomal protein S18 [Chloroflexi bacterium]|nr:30S ribosomal protein S18 [Chloroflexota bacterium]